MQRVYHANSAASAPWNLVFLLVGLTAGRILSRSPTTLKTSVPPKSIPQPSFIQTVSAEFTAKANNSGWLSALQDTVNHACDKERVSYWELAFNSRNSQVADYLRTIGTKQTDFNDKVVAKALILVADDISTLKKLSSNLETESKRMVDEATAIDRLGTFTNILDQMVAIVT